MPYTILNWISDLLWPSTCLGCRRAGVRLCRNCLDTLPPGPPPGHIGTISLITAGTMHSRVLERAIWYLKYRNAQELAAPLGDALTAAAGRAGIHGDAIVPIPLHPARLRQRGYNQAELIARRMAVASGTPCLPALRRVRNTKSQLAVQSRARRSANMVDVFQVANPDIVRERHVLLVDDVATTGATLESAAQALRQAGARHITACAVARG